MTFDREPDLDNANVGIPEQKKEERKAAKSVAFLFVLLRKIMEQEKKAW